jgi:osmotically-inducible protein OsmY
MKKFLWMTPIVLTAGLALAGCKDASDRPSTIAPVAERADGVKMSDADLEKAIKSKLEADEQTRQANLSVDAEVKDNKVSIKGTVPTQDVRAKAIELVKSVQPGLTVNDEIEVKPAG